MEGEACMKMYHHRIGRPGSIGVIFCMVLIGFSLMLAGCRASPLGFLFALSGDLATESDVKHKRVEVAGKSMSELASLLGEQIDTLTDTRSSHQFARFRPRNLILSDNFFIVRIAPDGMAGDLAWWMEGHDGFEDMFKQSAIAPKVENKLVEDAMRDAELDAPLFVFQSDVSTDELWVFDATNFTHLAPRLLILTINELEICIRAAYYGVAGGDGLWNPEEVVTVDP